MGVKGRRHGKGINDGGVGQPSRYRHPVETADFAQSQREYEATYDGRERLEQRRRRILARRQRERAEGKIA